MHSRDPWNTFRRELARRLRGLWLRPRLGSCGGGLSIARGAQLSHPGHLTLGRGVRLEARCEVQGLSSRGIRLGDGVTIGRGATLQPSSHPGSTLGEGLEIGARSAVGAYCWIGASGFVSIGSNVQLGPRVGILPEREPCDRAEGCHDAAADTRNGVVVEDDCRIGADAKLMAGIRIGRGAVVASGSVVTQDVEPHSVVGGVPAHFIRMREPRVLMPAA